MYLFEGFNPVVTVTKAKLMREKNRTHLEVKFNIILFNPTHLQVYSVPSTTQT